MEHFYMKHVHMQLCLHLKDFYKNFNNDFFQFFFHFGVAFTPRVANIVSFSAVKRKVATTKFNNVIKDTV